MQIWIHDNKMKKIVALNNDISDMLSYTNSSWHSYLDQATSTFDFTIPKFSNGELHEDLKLINDECFVSFYVNGSYQVFYIATLQEDDFNIQLTCNNTNLEYALEYANPFNSSSAQSIQWYLEHMDLLSFAAVEIGNNEISDRKRTLTFDSQETKMNRLQSLMSKFEAEFEFKVELNRDGTYKRIVINIYQKNHIGTDRKDVVLYYSNGLKGVQVSSDKTQMFNAGVFTGKDGLNLADVEISEKNADGIEEFYSRKGSDYVFAPLSRERYPSTMQPENGDNWTRKDFTTEYENVNDLKAYALRTLKQYAYPLVTYTASVQSGFVSQYTDLKLGDTIRIIDKNFVGGLALEARVSEMIISFDNPANNSFVFTNYRKLDNKPSAALQTRIEQVIESRLSYRIELATTGGVTFKNNEGETIIKPSLYKGNLPWTKDVTWHWTLNGVVTDGVQYRIQARDITDTAVLTVDAFVDGKKVATTEITLTNVNDGPQGPQGPQGDEGPQGPQGDTGNGIANTVVTYGLSMSDTTEPATWSSEMPALVKGMYLWTRTVIIYTNGESTTSYQISYIPKDADATAEIDKTKQELLEKLETVRDDSLAAVEEAKQQLETVRNDSLAAAEEAKQGLAEVNTKVDSAKAELTQAKQELTTVTDDLSQAKTDLQNAVSEVDTKATNLQSDLSQAKQDLTSQAQQLQAQANAQSELTKRVSSVEKTADGTKTTVSELSKTVAQNGKDITSVTARTKVVEDDLAGTKTTLSQVKTTADSTSQKTATLETGLNGLTAKFNSMSVGGSNLFKGSRDFSGTGWIGSAGAYAEDYQGVKIFKKQTMWSGYSQEFEAKTGEEYVFSAYVKSSAKTDRVTFYLPHPSKQPTATGFVGFDSTNRQNDVSFDLTDEYQRIAIKIKITEDGWIAPRIERYNTDAYLFFGGYKLEHGNVATDYSSNEADLEQKVAEYKQTADQNYASLSSTVQTLDGQVQSNKATAEQTAQGFKTRIESLETYKNGESERANAYFESAKTETAKQLTAERTAIANNYVAKSTYTSDVTGIRNDLTATTTTANTTKTNLANYQASNDKAVANLQSNLQEANGNISSLKTKVEAVPGQITSAVSAVEGKIPTSVGSTNLLLYSADPSKAPSGYYDFTGTQKTSETYNGSVVYRVQSAWNGLQINLGNVADRGLLKVGDVLTYSVAMRADQKTPIQARLFVRYTNQSDADSPTGKMEIVNLTANWQYVSVTFTVTAKMLAENTKVTYLGWELTSNAESGKYVYYACNKLECGSVATGYSPAPEDAIEEISSLSSQIQQTADGMTLLATKTELNTAKNDLQSGITTATNKANNAQATANSNAQTINTHTTQISALNTGLSAKVSQTDFNTLSGRVTSAENNITAKANELSSKISSVEGKIPTDVGATNLLLYSADPWKAPDGYYQFDGVTKTDKTLNGSAVYKTHTAWTSLRLNLGKQLIDRRIVKIGEEFTYSVWMRTDQVPMKVRLYARFSGQSGAEALAEIALNNDWQKFSVTFKVTEKMVASQTKLTLFGFEQTTNNESGKYVYYACNKLERGNIATDYTPAPEDTASQISSLSSELKQTADGITLLATKTELNSAKSELQSGITTATDKANAAQNTANNNAQTITTHTTQISALNTGLSAKVSQSDFNTLSGRVTTAENNIIAKANELSSKITSVEGAIEDTQSDITKLSSEIKQTTDGMTLLATKTELNTAKSDLQSGITTATNKANAAQSAANANAQTINMHTTQISALNTGLQAKVSQSEFNTLSGRVTTAENNITAKANELSSKISSVEGKIPTSVGTTNLLLYSADPWRAPDGYYQFDGVTKTDKTLNGSTVYKTNTAWSSLRLNLGKQLIDRRIVKIGEEFTYSVWMRTDQVPMKVRLFARFSGQSGADRLTGDITLTNDWQKFSVTFKVTDKMVASQTKLSWVGFEQTTNSENGKFVYYACNKLERGNVATDYTPAPEDTASQISSLSSEFKQTTDAIKASVSSLDKSTIKSSSLTINSDGIVMKAGKSTTDVANAIGSYFAVTQNAINLFSDKINVKGNMIVDGAITGDKIKANSVDVSKIVGIDANFIKSKIEYAMIDWLKGKTITAYNDNMTIDLQNGRISFKDGSNAIYRQTPDGIHTGFMHFEAGWQGGIYAAFGTTSTRRGINSKTAEFAGIRCYRVSYQGDSPEAKTDRIEVVGDVVQFGNGYRSDGEIGGGFIMDTGVYGEDTPYSLNRMVESIKALWRIFHTHAQNAGYRFNDPAFIRALNDEYNVWHDMHNQ